MARKLFCKLSHERGEKFSVGGKLYTVGADGFVEVEDDHAPVLLQNVAKWADANVAPAPFKRPTAPPQLILEDKATGRVLSEEETAKVMQETAPPAPEPAKEPELPPEPAPPEWPTLTTDSSKTEMLTTLDRLKDAGFVQAADYSAKMGKRDLLEAIERAYDSME